MTRQELTALGERVGWNLRAMCVEAGVCRGRLIRRYAAAGINLSAARATFRNSEKTQSTSGAGVNRG